MVVAIYRRLKAPAYGDNWIVVVGSPIADNVKSIR